MLALVLIPAWLATVGPSPARAGAPTCAPTLAQTGSPTLPCWSDVASAANAYYPFGTDGNPVDPNSTYCESQTNSGNPQVGDQSCYLIVDSLAFRAWNRGLAAVHPADGSTTPYGVWRYNGARWYPDPTFPGQQVCPGNTILWAGKLDAWLIGPGGGQAATHPEGAPWPVLCHFDGVLDEWEPLPVPAATIASTGATTGSITSGACFSHNDCWFFGTEGAVVHWDGQTLSNATVGLGASPWLKTSVTAATDATDAQGNPLALTVAAFGVQDGATQPDGAPPPQVLASTGEQFSPAAFSPAASSVTGNSPGTDLDGVAFDAQGDGWIAGNPSAPASSVYPTSVPRSAQDPAVGAAPLLPISSTGTPRSCTPPAQTPSWNGGASVHNGSQSYLWSSIGVLPGGDAVAGGVIQVNPGRANRFGSQETEPVLVEVSCDGTWSQTQFRIPDPTASDAGGAVQVPADSGGYVTAVAAIASNDAWAATSPGLTPDNAATPDAFEPPRLYQLTDGQAPLDVPTGNDVESRPVVITPEPTIFSIAPPVIITAPPPATTKYTHQKPKVNRVTLKPAVFDIGEPRVAKAAGGMYTLSLSFKVRRKVRIGLEAVRHGKVVSSSGLRTFTGTRGTLVVRLNPKAWPTGLKFILPKTK